MAIGDYILCCKCEVKLIYDGDRDQREWWEERFGKEPEIECPNCKPQRTWVGLMRGVRVEGDTVVISVKGGNDAARELCGALIEEKNT